MGVRERRLSGLLAVRSMLSVGTLLVSGGPSMPSTQCPPWCWPGGLGSSRLRLFPHRKTGINSPATLGCWGQTDIREMAERTTT